MKKFIIVLIVVLSMLNSAYTNAQDIRGSSFELRSDTLFSKLSVCDYTYLSCFKVGNTYISSMYEVIDSLPLRLNSDSNMDLLMVVSPKIQEHHRTSPCYYKAENKRLAIFWLSDMGTLKIHAINENLILNKMEYQSDPYKGVRKANKDFIISYYVGSSTRCEYDFRFKADCTVPLLRSESECYLIDLSKSKRSKKRYRNSKNLSAYQINIRDLITVPNLR